MDATRVSAGLYVSLMIMNKLRHPHEVEMGQYFTSEPLASHPKNHRVPFLECRRHRTKKLIVMLLLFFSLSCHSTHLVR
ncbi:uncharacterized protein HD556DRAFT_138757 [Suillus plorans]|uniref:Uncharacterized protein n=1 Tax=Suillus plorans TaxID=116603 RepID=A0A9P7AC77_9AGAM|nr:uncharacterized protein HD556DRAFT_138757 [Suillus plorans]KAG1785381.1 hypothetical protein HD556DRAFT_138757 [Suillus plorans]